MLQSLLDEVDAKKAELESLRPIKPEYLARIQDKFKLEYNYYSNHIEGNTLTLGETRSLILYSSATAIEKKIRDVQEMKGHIEMYDTVGFLQPRILTKDGKPLKLDTSFIKNLHKIIFVEDEYRPEGDGSAYIPAGQYKQSNNHSKTKTGEILYYADVAQVPQLMTDLLDWYNKARLSWHPITLAGVFHYKFVRIHPFGDANGRMARFLMNLILQSSGYMLSVVTSQGKESYLEALRRTDRNFFDIQACLESEELTKFEPFVVEIAKLVFDSTDLMIRGAKGEDISEAGDILRQFEMELKSSKQEDSVDRFWLTEDGNFANLLSQSIIPLLQKIEDFCFILAENNFAQMVSRTSFAEDDKLQLSKIESQQEYVPNPNNFYAQVSALSSITSGGSYEKKAYPKCFVGSYKNGGRQSNNWPELLDWYREDTEKFERVKNLIIIYDFEGYNLNRSKNLQVRASFTFADFYWKVHIDIGGNLNKLKFQYGQQITEEDVKNILRFLVSKSKRLLEAME